MCHGVCGCGECVMVCVVVVSVSWWVWLVCHGGCGCGECVMVGVVVVSVSWCVWLW